MRIKVGREFFGVNYFLQIIKGYRTLCYAMRELDGNIYEEWAFKFKEASTALEERENKLKEVAEEIEKELLLIGITAIEDKLQEV